MELISLVISHFVTEDDIIGNFFPEQRSRTEVFNFIESELIAIESTLKGARQNVVGRADQAAAECYWQNYI